MEQWRKPLRCVLSPFAAFPLHQRCDSLETIRPQTLNNMNRRQRKRIAMLLHVARASLPSPSEPPGLQAHTSRKLGDGLLLSVYCGSNGCLHLASCYPGSPRKSQCVKTCTLYLHVSTTNKNMPEHWNPAHDCDSWRTDKSTAIKPACNSTGTRCFAYHVVANARRRHLSQTER